MRTLVWFRGKDLRVSDHEPLRNAAAKGETIPLFVLDPYFFSPDRANELPYRMQFLLDSLAELAEALASRGSTLLVVKGPSVTVVPDIARAVQVDRVLAYRWTEPFAKERDRRVAEGLGSIPLELFLGETLAPPGRVLTGQGTPFAVFTPFSRAFMKSIPVAAPVPAPRTLPPLPTLPKSVTDRLVSIPTPEDLGLTRNPQIVSGGERAARARLETFLKGPGHRYEVGRDLMGQAGTSRLSQDLKFGTLSARTVWTAANEALATSPKASSTFLGELMWREFAYDVLEHSPRVLTEPYKPTWKGFPWRNDETAWRAWVEGKTGYPVVDAASRQLLASGFVHNRARMITASFLTKHLLLDFRPGEAHFLKFLTDGDWAINDLGWQWATGSGVDAQPWFRVFNPIAQGERFDPEGAYVRTWVPELKKVHNTWIHRPWEAPPLELGSAGVILGKTYPRPIVDHAFGRQRFLAAAKGHLG
jgi:deoxyribodipyrimidine photo-lyase